MISTARRVLEVVPGERRLLPSFGCRIHALDGFRRPQDRELAAGLVEEALERWVPWLACERADVREAARGGWIRVALRVASRWHEFDIKHRRRLATPEAGLARREAGLARSEAGLARKETGLEHPEGPPA